MHIAHIKSKSGCPKNTLSRLFVYNYTFERARGKSKMCLNNSGNSLSNKIFQFDLIRS